MTQDQVTEDVTMSAQIVLDKSALDAYLREHLRGFPAGEEEMTVQQFTEGHLNLNFHLCKSGKHYVLRRRLMRLQNQIQLREEFQFLSILGRFSFPAPRPLLFCDDETVIGGEFYIMEYCEGRVYPYEMYTGMSRDELRRMYESAVDTLAKLHDLDWEGLGLSFLGSDQDYLKKKVTQLTKQYADNAASGGFPSAENLMNWLINNVPDDGVKPVVLHSDYRTGNIVFHPTEPRVSAVLDWESLTLGHPFEDLAYFCSSYHVSIPNAFDLAGDSTPKPPEEDVLNVYCKLRKMTSPPQHWNYFLVLNFFRLACTLQDMGLHMSNGSQVSEEFKHITALLGPFIQIASQLAGLPEAHTQQE